MNFSDQYECDNEGDNEGGYEGDYEGDYKCNDKLCRIAKWLDEDIYITMTASFITGVLFSGISWGIIYVIIFLILYEFFYLAYKHANYKDYYVKERIGVILAALFGYVVGLIFHENDDFQGHYYGFWKDCDNYGKKFDWW